MRFKLLIIFLSLSLNFCSAQKDSDWKITESGIGNINLGNSLSQTIRELEKDYDIDKSILGTYPIYCKGEKKEFMLLSPIIGTDTIGNIRIYKGNWSTEDNLKIGMTIKEINKFYDGFFLDADYSSWSEYFYKIQEFEIDGKKYESITKFHFVGPTSDFLGTYEHDPKIGRYGKSTDNNEKGVLNFIEVSFVEKKQ